MKRLISVVALVAVAVSTAFGQQLERYKQKEFLTVSELRLAQKEAQEKKDVVAASEMAGLLSLIAEQAPLRDQAIETSTAPTTLREKEAFWIREIAPVYGARKTKELRSPAGAPARNAEEMTRQMEDLRARIRAISAEIDAHMARYFTAEEYQFYRERQKRQAEANLSESQKQQERDRRSKALRLATPPSANSP